MNVIHKLQQDEETALDALGELAQKDSTEATIAEDTMINNSVLYNSWLKLGVGCLSPNDAVARPAYCFLK